MGKRAFFHERVFQEAVGLEKDFDEIFKYVADNLGFKFDWQEYNEIIKNKTETVYC